MSELTINYLGFFHGADHYSDGGDYSERFVDPLNLIPTNPSPVAHLRGPLVAPVDAWPVIIAQIEVSGP